MELNFIPRDQDVVLAGGLISSPAWAGWLAQVNMVLTTVTLLLGVALGVARLWSLYRKRWPR